MPKNLGLYKDNLSTPRKKDVDACYGPNNAPPYPVTSVNKKTRAVVLDASDVNAVAKTGDSMTGTLTVGSASLETNGYVTGTWFKTTANTALSTKPSKIAVIDNGWIYSRTPAQIKNDIGLNNVDNIKQYSASNPPPYPVTSVNGQTGAVTVNVPTVPSTTNILKGNGSGGVVAATRGSDYIASGNIVKQTLVSTETTPTENYAINWVYS